MFKWNTYFAQSLCLTERRNRIDSMWQHMLVLPTDLHNGVPSYVGYLKNLLLQSKITPKNFVWMFDMIFIICRLPLIVVHRNTNVSVMLTNKSQPGNNVLHPANVRSFAVVLAYNSNTPCCHIFMPRYSWRHECCIRCIL